MKKVFWSIAIVLCILVFLVLKILRSDSDFKSIYFVPAKASVLIECADPLKAWDQVVHSDMMQHYMTHDVFKEMQQMLTSYDSLVNSSKKVFSLIGSKAVLLAQIPVQNGRNEFLYIIDVGKAATMKNPDQLLKSVLGKEFSITLRKYKERKLIEVFNTEAEENYFICFAEGKVLFSFDPNVLELAIDASQSMRIGKDMKYLAVQSKLTNKGLFQIIVIHKNLKKSLAFLSAELEKSTLNYLNQLTYTGLSFDFYNELIAIDAYVSFSDSVANTYANILQSGNQSLQSIGIIPNRLASLVKLNFHDLSSFIENSIQQMGQAEFEDYLKSKEKIEKRLKVNFDDLLFSWMQAEVVLLQTRPSNLGRANDFAAIVHTDDGKQAGEKLDELWYQIKKQTPVKISKVPYKGFEISYVDFPGIIRALFGKALSKIEKPFITIIENQVIFSNHPQTIKNIIDDYLVGETLQKDYPFFDFNKHFKSSTSAFFYFEPPVLYHNLRAFVAKETWTDLQKNKGYITCFSQGGAQIREESGLLHANFRMQFDPNPENFEVLTYKADDLHPILAIADTLEEKVTPASMKRDTIPEIYISDLDAKKHEEYYENGKLRLWVAIKKGTMHGDFKAFYENGKIHIKGQFKDGKPTGKWKYFNVEGKLTKTDRY